MRWLQGAAAAVMAVLLSACGGAQQASAPAPGAIPTPPPQVADLYNRSCRSCHHGGAGGAPRTGRAQDWEPRLFQGLDVLLDHTISGYKGMPPMGMCMDCDEDQFVGLIEYMAGQALE